MTSRGGNMDRTIIMQGSGSGAARPSMAPQNSSSGPGSVVKTRQLTHLHSQLAQLSANLADTENLLRMTSVQAEAMRGLGSWHGGLFMAASKVLGEESVKEQAQTQQRPGRS
ncbi:DASH complex subunit Hsk3 like-domain-containing protein [Daldinia caldariorum]|uniref:DASH complex subunit Hsk3 like-domain-containing protein n=1 Tax=Daldinia caldariorum TaxID=326644 RepID=UPI0020079348|nr:DASH complex subunit Hsk3 like-domain-containing protein [Daldinia caldariorum]KAI1466504.1 DASH complex subunit Hsk3 like-domain-containing protein [Daldinia caldariorum]